MAADDCNPRGILRPTVGELVLRRRMRVLREILENKNSPHHDRLVGLCDMLIETERTTPAEPSHGYTRSAASKR